MTIPFIFAYVHRHLWRASPYLSTPNWIITTGGIPPHSAKYLGKHSSQGGHQSIEQAAQQPLSVVIVFAALALVAATAIMLVAARLVVRRGSVGQALLAALTAAVIAYAGMAVMTTISTPGAVVLGLAAVVGGSLTIIRMVFTTTWPQAALMLIINVGAQMILGAVISRWVA